MSVEQFALNYLVQRADTYDLRQLLRQLHVQRTSSHVVGIVSDEIQRREDPAYFRGRSS